MKKFSLLLLTFILFTGLAWVIIKQLSFDYDIYRTSEIIYVDQASIDRSQSSGAGGLLFGNTDASKRITEFIQITQGKSAAIALLKEPSVRQEVAYWRSNQFLSSRQVSPEDLRPEDVVAFINKSVTVTVLHDSGILQLEFVASTPEMSHRFLDLLTQYFIEFSRSNALAGLLKQREELYSELSRATIVSVGQALSNQISTISTRIALANADATFGIKILDAAYTGQKPANMSPMIQAGLAIFAGIVLSFMVYILIQIINYARREESQ
ncbi:hypothetical protein [Tistrella mobilis]|uniref:hypothetical protein n=1 Tax=Tistrella mobilis TaxID=171437 RepID=UPI00059F5A7D|nr:hypothetical protein [Tistrella mobilis]